MTTAPPKTTKGKKPSELTPRQKLDAEFKRTCKKKGWFTYFDDESGRVVTNAYRHELDVVSAAAGVECELVSSLIAKKRASRMDMMRIGPKLFIQDTPVGNTP